MIERDKIKVGKTYTYATPSATGAFKVLELLQDSNGSSWVRGFDRAKKKDIKVRPGQLYPASK